MEDVLIWVDEQDREIGYGEKWITHQEEHLHRAFSLFLFRENDGKLLIHRRAEGKYHSGGLWTNACCSHPRKGENLRDAVIRRMEEELGLRLPDTALRPGSLKELGKFQYYQKYDDCAESEIDHVFYLSVCGDDISLCPDPGEITEVRWVTVRELKDWMAAHPQDFTAWFAPAFSIVEPYLAGEGTRC